MTGEWHDLFVATSGAAATLTGLIFVGVSINLTKILSLPTLPERALLALFFLLAILIQSLLMLIPKQSIIINGIEVSVLAFALWCMTARIDFYVYRHTAKAYFKKYYFLNILLNQVTIIPYLIGGITLLYANEDGFYWITASFILSLIKSIADSWVLLVEINR